MTPVNTKQTVKLKRVNRCVICCVELDTTD